jgi:hypothetical protein
VGLSASPLLAQLNDHTNDVGVLVMAHGGDSTWNAAVRDAVLPLRQRWNTELAFGMADPGTLDSALTRLGATGVRRVAVVRLFLSGDAFRHATEYLLRLRPDAPDVVMPQSDSAGPALLPIHHQFEIAMNDLGLAWDPRIADILALRSAVLSMHPQTESVLLWLTEWVRKSLTTTCSQLSGGWDPESP